MVNTNAPTSQGVLPIRINEWMAGNKTTILDPANGKFGIFAKISKPDAVLRDKDRVEIYRPLIADPKEVRRQRAAEGKVMKKGAGAVAAEAE
jgi:putative ubiquitin-RnfH superfamily antitoxin RatB of RatAB toxin-antitoxin module